MASSLSFVASLSSLPSLWRRGASGRTDCGQSVPGWVVRGRSSSLRSVAPSFSSARLLRRLSLSRPSLSLACRSSVASASACLLPALRGFLRPSAGLASTGAACGAGALSSSAVPLLTLRRPRPNPSIQGTAGKRRFACLPVPSSLRSSAAPDLERWAARDTAYSGLNCVKCTQSSLVH